MNRRTDDLTRWVYSGVWGILTAWFKVPDTPPTLPVKENEPVRSFRPAPGYLRYLKFQFWLGLVVLDTLILVGWLILLIAAPVIGVILAIPAFALAILPDIVAYVALHLRYDTMWYVMTDRSIRIRHGIWTIQEMTFTFENVQNVKVTQGPLQRYFGIADVVVETAGGGSAVQKQQGVQPASMHHGQLKGVANGPEIRDLILHRLRRSKTGGLGDEIQTRARHGGGWNPTHVAALREIRDLCRRLAHER